MVPGPRDAKTGPMGGGGETCGSPVPWLSAACGGEAFACSSSLSGGGGAAGLRENATRIFAVSFWAFPPPTGFLASHNFPSVLGLHEHYYSCCPFRAPPPVPPFLAPSTSPPVAFPPSLCHRLTSSLSLRQCPTARRIVFRSWQFSPPAPRHGPPKAPPSSKAPPSLHPSSYHCEDHAVELPCCCRSP